MKTRTSYRSVDFHPAPPGWRSVFLADDGTITTEPMPGWLIQEEIEFDAETFEDISPTGYRRVVASYMDGAELEPVSDFSGFWCVISPDQPLPTAEQAAEELASRRAGHGR
ncbi:hypothetical protein FLW53_28515 [Microbispora sp. SCL1-1]|uniref:hypothetical protein n=1 Tax=unclassified Microbispora TaxID=2614687 RepID=UPI0011575772|nr:MULTISPECIES: hypothetical protein [unclassified Microbispora]NJP28074.1 hypothetical protein [Microbispora sp. CL1-1]TQS09433.1 hypothetical protein FLW53_28515 [Microbispora sp. SCL1-1]